MRVTRRGVSCLVTSDSLRATEETLHSWAPEYPELEIAIFSHSKWAHPRSAPAPGHAGGLRSPKESGEVAETLSDVVRRHSTQLTSARLYSNLCTVSV